MASTQQSNINLGLAQIPETTNPEVFPEATKIYSAIKRLALYVEAFTGNTIYSSSEYPIISNSQSLIAGNSFKVYKLFTVAASFGQLVGVAGNDSVQLASDGGVAAIGFCAEPSGVLAGAWGAVQCAGLYRVSGLTAGTRYFLSTVAGSIQTAAPAGLKQVIGIAMNTTDILFLPYRLT